MSTEAMTAAPIRLWLIAGAVTALLLYVLRDALMPFAAGIILAYLLDPLARRMERLGLSRLAASLLILIVFIVCLISALLVVVPILAKQLFALVDRVPEYIARLQAFAAEKSGPLLERFGGGQPLPDVQKSLGDALKQAGGWAAALLSSLWSQSQAVIAVLSLLVITPIVAFYVLADWQRMIALIDNCLPRPQAGAIRAIASDIDGAIAGFIRGQSLVCLFLALWYAIGLMLVGLNYGLLIGVAAGLLSFIPFAGSAAGLLVALAVGFSQFWPDWTQVALVGAVFASGQFLEGNILSPKLVGKSVGLHPVWLMFALFAFGSLFGFTGLLLAVPLAATAGVLARHGLKHYKASPLYGGAPAGPNG